MSATRNAAPSGPGARMTAPPPGYWGKYRGTVLDNIDPFEQGRLMCEVVALPGMLTNWALPCIPYAGLDQGLFALPPIGANVWIEFENGNPSYPIWTGCYWEIGQIPLAIEESPEDPALMKVFKSQFCTLAFNDTPGEGGITLSVIDPAVDVPVTLTMTSAGLEVNVGPVNFSMNAEAGITMEAGEAVVKLTEAASTTEAPLIELTSEGDVNVTGTTTIEGETNVTLALTVEGDTNVAGAFTAEGDANVAGAFTAEGEANVAGALTAEGEVNVAGALTAEGEVNVAGLLSVEGDVNILGAAQIEGNLAVLGIIEGVIVPPF